MEDWEAAARRQRVQITARCGLDLSWHPRARHVRRVSSALRQPGGPVWRSAAADLIVFVDTTTSWLPTISRRPCASGATGRSRRLGLGRHRSGIRDAARPQVSKLVPNSPCGWRHRALVATCSMHGCHALGAGLCLRAEVAAAYCGHARTQRSNPEPAWPPGPGEREDVEMCYVACKMGWASRLPSLKITHLIRRAGYRQIIPRIFRHADSQLAARLQMARSPARRASIPRRLLSLLRRGAAAARNRAPHDSRAVAPRPRRERLVAASRECCDH